MPTRGVVTHLDRWPSEARARTAAAPSTAPSSAPVIPSACVSLPGPGAEVSVVDVAPARRISVEPVRRLEGTKQHGRPGALGLTGDVDAPVDAVRAVDVQRARCGEHRAVSRRAPAKRVTRRVVGRVRLDLDDPATDAVTRSVQPSRPRATSCTLPRAAPRVSIPSGKSVGWSVRAFADDQSAREGSAPISSRIVSCVREATMRSACPRPRRASGGRCRAPRRRSARARRSGRRGRTCRSRGRPCAAGLASFGTV